MKLFSAVRFVCLWLALGLVIMSGSALAQNLPRHIDPNQRMERPDLSAVPSIRVLAMTGYPPFSFRLPSGEIGGYNVDLAKAICEVLEVVCTIQAWPFEQAAEALADNQGDMLLGGLALTPENAERFDFSTIYLSFPARLVVQAQLAASVSTDQLAGKRIGVRIGSTHHQFVASYFIDAEPIAFDDEFLALEALAAGELDAVFADGLRAAFWLNQNPDCCAFTRDVYYRPDLFGHGLAMAFPQGRATLRRAVDYALWLLSRDGRLDELYLRWFPVSFY